MKNLMKLEMIADISTKTFKFERARIIGLTEDSALIEYRKRNKKTLEYVKYSDIIGIEALY